MQGLPATEAFAKPRETYLITRRFLATIRGSFQQFSQSGQEAASWSPNNGKVGDVFGISEIIQQGPHVVDGISSAGALQNAVLHRITVLESKNEFPLTLGVGISCIPNDESTRTGHKYAMTSLAQSHNPTPLTLFEAEPTTNEGMQWRQEYPQYNSNNLETFGVLNVQGETFVFVSKSHPSISLLRKYKDRLNADIDNQPLIDGEWYKISKQMFGETCRQLRSKVLSKVNTRDLNNFTIQIHRTDKKDWTNVTVNDELISALPFEIAASGNQTAVKEAIAHMLKRQYSWHARVEICYEVMA